MSEPVKKNRGRVRRNVVALVSAVSLACGSVAVPQIAGNALAADTGKIQDLDARYGEASNLEFNVDLSVDNQYPTQEFNYIVTTDSGAPRWRTKAGVPGESNLLNFEFWIKPDENTELIDPSNPSFEWNSGKTRSFRTEDLGDGRLLYLFDEIPDGDFLKKATIPARVTNNDGKPFTASARAWGQIRPTVDWVPLRQNLQIDPKDDGLIFFNSSKNPNSPGFVPVDGRHAELWSEYQLAGGGYGSQVLQMFVGLENTGGGPDVQFSGGRPRDRETGGDATAQVEADGYWVGDGIAVKVTDPDGNVITDEVMDRARAAAQPFRPIEPYDATKGNPQFHRGFHWFPGEPEDYVANIDDVISDDELWLRSGTVIEIHQLVSDPAARFGRVVRDQYGMPRIEYPAEAATHIVSGRPALERESYDEFTFARTASVGDRVWVDANANGVQDAGESGLAGITVTVSGNGETFSAKTDANGDWTVEGLTPGVEYTVEFTLPDGYKSTKALVGNDRSTDSNGLRSAVTLAPGEYNQTYDLGVFEPASVGDFVWNDANKNGVQDDGEKGIPNVVVKVAGPNGVTTTTTTGENGEWSVGNLDPGEYTVTFVKPAGWELSPTGKAEQDKDSNGLTTTGVTLKPGDSNSTIDLGLYKPETTTPTATVTETATPTVTETITTPRECPTCTPTTVNVTETKSVPTTVPTTVTNVETSNVTSTEKTTVTQSQQVTSEVKVTETSTVTSTVKEPAATTTVNGRATTVTQTREVEVPTTVTRTSTVTTPTTVTEVIPANQVATIGDKVFVDRNNNGKFDQGEPGVPNVTIKITNRDNGNVSYTVTDQDGNWKGVGKPGNYDVEFNVGRQVPGTPPTGVTVVNNTPTWEITVQANETKNVQVPVLPNGSIGDRVWEDTNGNGQDDNGEKGVPNVAVKVERQGEPTRVAITDNNGNWTIDGLTPNVEYTITYIKPENWSVTGKVPNSTDGLTTKVKLKPGEENFNVDLGIKRPTPTAPNPTPGIFGLVWLDLDVNKIENGEKGEPGITVNVYGPNQQPGVDTPVGTTKTDAGGSWYITGLDPNIKYTVEFVLPKGYEPTTNTVNVTNNTVIIDGVTPGKNASVNLGVNNSNVPDPITETTTVTTTVTPPAQQGSSDDTLEKCWANAKASPLLYLIPVALLGAIGGELARPYAALVNEQVNKINADIAAAFNRNTPDFGRGGQGVDRDDPFAELRAQIDAANRQVQQAFADPNVQRLGTALGVLAGIAALGGILYDWCTSEPGEAKTASSLSNGSRNGSSKTTTDPKPEPTA